MPEERHKKGGGTYIHFTEQEIQDAKSISMIDFLYKHEGWTFQRVGSHYRGKEHDSLMIEPNQLGWHWNSRDKHGSNAIDWLRNVDGKTFTQALTTLIGSPTNTLSENIKSTEFKSAPKEPIVIEEIKKLEIPEKTSGKMNRAFAYLNKTRCIDSDIINQLLHEKLIYQDVNGNVVFAGYDTDGVMKFAERKSTDTFHKYNPINVKGSDKRYSFNVSVDKDAFPAAEGILYVFEAPVDLLSHATFKMMNEKAKAAKQGVKPNLNAWRNANRLSLSGLSPVALDSYLERNPQINMIIFALDNDVKGREAAEKFEKIYSEKYKCLKILPTSDNTKDWNEYLQKTCAELEYKHNKQNEQSADKQESDEIFVAQHKGGRK